MLGNDKGATVKRTRKPVSIIIVVLVVALLSAFYLPVNYVVESPGPTFNTIGKFDGQDLISVEGKKTYPTTGALDMTTVMVSGGPGRDITVGHAILAILEPQRDLIPRPLVYDESQTRQQVDEQSSAMMAHSQTDAVAAALHAQDIDFTRKFMVMGFTETTKADGLLKLKDEILTADGRPIAGVAALRQQLTDLEEDTITLGLMRDSKEIDVDVPVVTNESGERVIGVLLSNTYEFPFDVKVNLDDVGGPSAGLMFSLAIVDKMTPGDMTGGKHFAGTGTIDADGTVGSIGGIPQKVAGAQQQGAEYFLAPEENCAQLRGRVPAGITVFSVKNLSDARKIVEQIGGESDHEKAIQGLPQCQ